MGQTVDTYCKNARIGENYFIHADLIPSLAKAAIAVGADGLIIEMHPNPAEAKSDGAQSLTPDQFRELVQDLQIIARSVNRELDLPVADTGIEPLRKKINLIDRDIVQLLADRMKLVQAFGHLFCICLRFVLEP
jgi:3-deoxy-D-arabinoheptulosonate-7-phosphate synthase (EC 2.5.1.54)